MENISFNQRANFATSSRLITSVINEGIVNAIFVSEKNLKKDERKGNNNALISGIIFVLPNSEITNFNNENCIISVQASHKPILSSTQRVEFIDPWDIIFPINKIEVEGSAFLNDDESSMKSILSLLDDSDSVGEEISSVELMRIISVWMKADDDLSKQIISEIDSSVKYQEYTYENCSYQHHQLSLLSSSIEWEQSLLEGHSTHPMHKARYPISPIPEIPTGTYDFMNPLVRFVEVPADKMVIRGPFNETIKKITKLMSSPPPLKKDTILVPVHEMQIPNVESKFPFVNILPKEYSIKAKSQASVRTIVIPGLNDIVFKLPLGIKISSALRTVTPWTVHSGTALGIGDIFEKLDVDSNLLKICKEFAGVYPIEKNFDIAKHLTCIIREDLNESNSGGERIVVCAALTERDEFNKSVVEKVWNLDTEEKRTDFFESYVGLLFKALLPIAVKNGFSFEAHSQNILARFDPNNSQLIGFAVRDYGGIKHHQDTLFESTNERADVLKDNVTEAKDLLEVYDLVYHTLILCNVHRLARALNLHYNGIGWSIVRKHFKRNVPEDHLFYKTFLEQDKINFKCFMRMKFDGLYRDYIYSPVPNLMLYRGEDNS